MPNRLAIMCPCDGSTRKEITKIMSRNFCKRSSILVPQSLPLNKDAYMVSGSQHFDIKRVNAGKSPFTSKASNPQPVNVCLK